MAFGFPAQLYAQNLVLDNRQAQLKGAPPMGNGQSSPNRYEAPDAPAASKGVDHTSTAALPQRSSPHQRRGGPVLESPRSPVEFSPSPPLSRRFIREGSGLQARRSGDSHRPRYDNGPSRKAEWTSRAPEHPRLESYRYRPEPAYRDDDYTDSGGQQSTALKNTGQFIREPPKMPRAMRRPSFSPRNTLPPKGFQDEGLAGNDWSKEHAGSSISARGEFSFRGVSTRTRPTSISSDWERDYPNNPFERSFAEATPSHFGPAYDPVRQVPAAQLQAASERDASGALSPVSVPSADQESSEYEPPDIGTVPVSSKKPSKGTSLGNGTSKSTDDNLSLLSGQSASTRSSSGTSRGKSKLCYVCNRPATVDPLVKCICCNRRYHKGCHKPIISANVGADSVFVCQRCLKKDISAGQRLGKGVHNQAIPTGSTNTSQNISEILTDGRDNTKGLAEVADSAKLQRSFPSNVQVGHSINPTGTDRPVKRRKLEVPLSYKKAMRDPFEVPESPDAEQVLEALQSGVEPDAVPASPPRHRELNTKCSHCNKRILGAVAPSATGGVLCAKCKNTPVPFTPEKAQGNSCTIPETPEDTISICDDSFLQAEQEPPTAPARSAIEPSSENVQRDIAEDVVSSQREDNPAHKVASKDSAPEVLGQNPKHVPARVTPVETKQKKRHRAQEAEPWHDHPKPSIRADAHGPKGQANAGAEKEMFIQYKRVENAAAPPERDPGHDEQATPDIGRKDPVVKNANAGPDRSERLNVTKAPDSIISTSFSSGPTSSPASTRGHPKGHKKATNSDRPDLTYAEMLGLALLNAPGRRLRPKGISQWISENIPGYSLADKHWINATNAVLSQKQQGKCKHPLFELQPQEQENGKRRPGLWALLDGAEDFIYKKPSAAPWIPRPEQTNTGADAVEPPTANPVSHATTRPSEAESERVVNEASPSTHRVGSLSAELPHQTITQPNKHHEETTPRVQKVSRSLIHKTAPSSVAQHSPEPRMPITESPVTQEGETKDRSRKSTRPIARKSTVGHAAKPPLKRTPQTSRQSTPQREETPNSGQKPKAIVARKSAPSTVMSKLKRPAWLTRPNPSLADTTSVNEETTGSPALSAKETALVSSAQVTVPQPASRSPSQITTTPNSAFLPSGKGSRDSPRSIQQLESISENRGNTIPRVAPVTSHAPGTSTLSEAMDIDPHEFQSKQSTPTDQITAREAHATDDGTSVAGEYPCKDGPKRAESRVEHKQGKKSEDESRDTLAAENRRLKELLAAHGISFDSVTASEPVDVPKGHATTLPWEDRKEDQRGRQQEVPSPKHKRNLERTSNIEDEAPPSGDRPLRPQQFNVKKLFEAYPAYRPGGDKFEEQFIDWDEKVEQIKKRPTRKQRFGTRRTYSAHVWPRKHSNETSMPDMVVAGGGDEMEEAKSLEDVLGNIDHLIPAVYDNQLVFRDDNRDALGRLKRTKNYYKIGLNAKM